MKNDGNPDYRQVVPGLEELWVIAAIVVVVIVAVYWDRIRKSASAFSILAVLGLAGVLALVVFIVTDRDTRRDRPSLRDRDSPRLPVDPPTGTVRMVDRNGNRRDVPDSEVESAGYSGWSEDRFAPTKDTGEAWWCTGNWPFTCDPRLSACDAIRKAYFEERGLNAPKCRGQAKAACFSRKNKLQGNTESTCFESFTHCGSRRDEMMKNSYADWTITADCHAE